jgi:hypothetical protein
VFALKISLPLAHGAHHALSPSSAFPLLDQKPREKGTLLSSVQ